MEHVRQSWPPSSATPPGHAQSRRQEAAPRDWGFATESRAASTKCRRNPSRERPNSERPPTPDAGQIRNFTISGPGCGRVQPHLVLFRPSLGRAHPFRAVFGGSFRSNSGSLRPHSATRWSPRPLDAPARSPSMRTCRMMPLLPSGVPGASSPTLSRCARTRWRSCPRCFQRGCWSSRCCSPCCPCVSSACSAGSSSPSPRIEHPRADA